MRRPCAIASNERNFAMITLRPSHERGHTAIDWLDSRHSFSFGGYHDPAHVHFRHLRVINDDRVAPGAGFPTHPHRDMEILTYVVEGALAHRDSMGNAATIEAGHLQIMSAGRGITHSEYNASATDPVHFLQIWLLPSEHGTEPRYAEWAPRNGQGEAGLALLASPEGAEGSAAIGQDVRLYRVNLAAREAVGHESAPERSGWLQVIRGAGTINGVAFGPGDGVALRKESAARIEATEAVEALFFDLA